MQLKTIETNVALNICEEVGDKKVGQIYKATFYELASGTSFLARSMDLHRNFYNLRKGGFLRIEFVRGSTSYNFKGRAIKSTMKGGLPLTEIEALSEIGETSRRDAPRNEIRTDVSLYQLTENETKQTEFDIAEREADFSCETLDISASGFCLVTNSQINVSVSPYFLSEFSCGNSKFLLPVKLVRTGNCPQTALYRYDYGFIFIFDNIPQEKDRLVTALFNIQFAKIRR